MGGAEAEQDDFGDVVGLAAGIFGRQRMGAEIGGDDPHRPQGGKPAGRAQHAQFGLDFEAIAGLDLDGADAFGQQRIEPGQGLGHEVIDAQGPRGTHGGGDAAAGFGDVDIF